MADPDVGYKIPDEEWQGWEDEETGLTLYPDDPFASERLEILRRRTADQESNSREQLKRVSRITR